MNYDFCCCCCCWSMRVYFNLIFFRLVFLLSQNRHALIAVRKIRRGHRWRTVYSFVLIAQLYIGIWAYIWHLYDRQIWTRTGHGFNWDKCNWVAMQMRHNSFVNTIAIRRMHSKSTIHVRPHSIAINWVHWHNRQWNSMARL